MMHARGARRRVVAIRGCSILSGRKCLSRKNGVEKRGGLLRSMPQARMSMKGVIDDEGIGIEMGRVTWRVTLPGCYLSSIAMAKEIFLFLHARGIMAELV